MQFNVWKMEILSKIRQYGKVSKHSSDGRFIERNLVNQILNQIFDLLAEAGREIQRLELKIEKLESQCKS